MAMHKDCVTSLSIPHSRDETRTLVKVAFERTRGIKTYFDDSRRITGKTGFSLGSYGEAIIVDLSETSVDPTQTIITVRAEKEIDINITANPEKYRSRFLTELKQLRDQPIEKLLLDFPYDYEGKEVYNAEDQAGEMAEVALVIIGITAVIALFLTPFLII